MRSASVAHFAIALTLKMELVEILTILISISIRLHEISKYM